MEDPPVTSAAGILAEVALEIARAGASAGIVAIHKHLLGPALDDEGGKKVILSQASDHAGSPARPIDAAAQKATRDGAKAAIVERQSLLESYVSDVSYVGEEAGTQTELISDRTLIVRTDPLDGTTNAVNTLGGFGSVVTVDIVTDATRRPRHLAGAIFGGDFDVSWFHWSRRRRGAENYVGPAGTVLVRSTRLPDAWYRLDAPQQERDLDSLASVAATRERFRLLEPYRNEVLQRDGTVYHVAGNPMWAGLLMGTIGNVVEVKHVTLHDSAFLIPHWLLGGRLEALDGSPLDYLDVYERNATNFDPKHKPVPPFRAAYDFGEWQVAESGTTAGPDAPAAADRPARPRLFRQPR